MADAANYSDFELIQAWLGGDARAFDALYARYKRPLYGYFYNMVRQDPATVDDLFQQLWMRVMRKLPDYRECDRFGAWIFRIARNLVIDYYRQCGRRPEIRELTMEAAAALPEPGGGGREPWRALEAAELGRRVERVVKELPEEQREVFLCRQEEMSFRDIAALQHCPLNTALARMQYALKYLRRRLNNWETMEDSHE